MALVLKDRVKETTTTTGTGTITLAGAATGYQSFSAIGNANSTYYCIAGGSEWEVGIGTYTASGTTLSRDTILSSSNSGSAVNFSAGTKDVFVVYPAGKAVYGLIDPVNVNVAVGEDALTANTTGFDNVAVGSFVLNANTVGWGNTIVGSNAAYSNTTGEGNSALGEYALYDNTTGYSNVAVGNAAMYNNVSGHSNTVVGDYAFNQNTAGNANVAVGKSALYFNTASNNVAVGSAALTLNTTGTENVAVGTDALRSNTTASDNTVVGFKAARSTTTGQINSVFGALAFYTNTTGYENVAVGDSSMYFNTSGYNNVAIGNASLYENTTGYSNVAVGRQALYVNTTGYSNVALGYQAMRSATTPIENTAVGFNAMYSHTTGDSNVAVGTRALYSNPDGYYNTAIGYYSLDASTSISNTGVGAYSLQKLTSGSKNTAVGDSALIDSTTSTLNTAIGWGSGGAITTGSKNSILGAYSGNQGGLDIRTASNYIVLSDGDGNPRVVTDGSGNVGVGATFPFVRLHAQTTSATTNAVTQVLRVDSQSSGTPANGIGVGIEFATETAAGNTEVGATIEAITTDVTSTSEDFDLSFKTMAAGAAAAERMRVNLNGVRIPNDKYYYGNNSVGSASKLIGRGSDDVLYVGDTGFNNATKIQTGNATINFIANGSERLLINTDGEVNINCTAIGSTKLRIYQNGNSNDNSYSGIDILKGSNDTTTAQVFQRFFTDAGSAGNGSITANGVSAATFTAYSDRRLKENVVDLPPQLENICRLKPSEFDYIGYPQGKGHQIGFIAQDMQEVYPDVVAPDGQGMLQIAGWSKTEARLVKAIQELKSQLDAVNAELQTLKEAKNASI